MRGFGTFASAARFCPAFEEQRQFFRVTTPSGKRVSPACQRDLFRERWARVLTEVAAA